jgi:hypothetical protein
MTKETTRHGLPTDPVEQNKLWDAWTTVGAIQPKLVFAHPMHVFECLDSCRQRAIVEMGIVADSQVVDEEKMQRVLTSYWWFDQRNVKPVGLLHGEAWLYWEVKRALRDPMLAMG